MRKGEKERAWITGEHAKMAPLGERFKKRMSPEILTPPMEKVATDNCKCPAWATARCTEPDCPRKVGKEKVAYKLQGHTNVQGLRIAIENRKGSVRKPPKGLRALLPWGEKRPRLQRKQELGGVLGKWVDYQASEGKDFPARTNEVISVPMSKRQTQLHDMAWSALPGAARSRLRSGLPPRKKDLGSINAFQSQARQISNTDQGFGGKGASPKIEKAVDLLEAEVRKNPKHRAVVYSNYLNALDAYKGELDQRGISHGEFTGATCKERLKAVGDYNKGKIKALLVSSAGGEGLDLEGTRQTQVLEPHWNEEKINQVIGRTIRRGSHKHLPVGERHVTVQRFEAHPRSEFRKALRIRPREGVDQMLRAISTGKDRLNKELIGILRKIQEEA